eukprot:TRINITY_DN11884_c0_g1_i1.p1 TRINITY_DN11884_c0_g1~~TRINITY_DN11884_c0_g1_i1.p1  ORF type:complete len:199 (+),score=78.55 TRINITY_DN11884_c0_g1_i1:289-885(+)
MHFSFSSSSSSSMPSASSPSSSAASFSSSLPSSSPPPSASSSSSSSSSSPSSSSSSSPEKLDPFEMNIGVNGETLLTALDLQNNERRCYEVISKAQQGFLNTCLKKAKINLDEKELFFFDLSNHTSDSYKTLQSELKENDLALIDWLRVRKLVDTRNNIKVYSEAVTSQMIERACQFLRTEKSVIQFLQRVNANGKYQ